MVAEPPTRKRGRPKLTTPEEQQKEERRLKHRQAQRKLHKKIMMMAEMCKKKREERQKKELVRLRKFLSHKAMRLLRQQVEQEEHRALKKAKE